eukprot:2076347-Amphidinium_carterae.1
MKTWSHESHVSRTVCYVHCGGQAKSVLCTNKHIGPLSQMQSTEGSDEFQMIVPSLWSLFRKEDKLRSYQKAADIDAMNLSGIASSFQLAMAFATISWMWPHSFACEGVQYLHHQYSGAMVRHLVHELEKEAC